VGVRKETTVGLGVNVMGALTYLKVQSTRTQLNNPNMKAQRLSRTCPHSAQVALRVKTRMETEVITDTFDHLLLEQLDVLCL